MRSSIFADAFFYLPLSREFFMPPPSGNVFFAPFF
jgi:hypothetical protein